MSKVERANLNDPFTEAGPGTPHGGLYYDYMAKWETPAYIRFAQATLGVAFSVATWPLREYRRFQFDRDRG